MVIIDYVDPFIILRPYIVVYLICSCILTALYVIFHRRVDPFFRETDLVVRKKGPIFLRWFSNIFPIFLGIIALLAIQDNSILWLLVIFTTIYPLLKGAQEIYWRWGVDTQEVDSFGLSPQKNAWSIVLISTSCLLFFTVFFLKPIIVLLRLILQVIFSDISTDPNAVLFWTGYVSNEFSSAILVNNISLMFLGLLLLFIGALLRATKKEKIQIDAIFYSALACFVCFEFGGRYTYLLPTVAVAAVLVFALVLKGVLRKKSFMLPMALGLFSSFFVLIVSFFYNFLIILFGGSISTLLTSALVVAFVFFVVTFLLGWETKKNNRFVLWSLGILMALLIANATYVFPFMCSRPPDGRYIFGETANAWQIPEDGGMPGFTPPNYFTVSDPGPAPHDFECNIFEERFWKDPQENIVQGLIHLGDRPINKYNLGIHWIVENAVSPLIGIIYPDDSKKLQESHNKEVANGVDSRKIINMFIGGSNLDEQNNFLNQVTNDQITFAKFSRGESDTTNPYYKILVNDKQIQDSIQRVSPAQVVRKPAEIMGKGQSLFGFSPDNKYFGFRAKHTAGCNDCFYFEIDVIDLDNLNLVRIMSPRNGNETEFGMVTAFIESYTWVDNGIDVVSTMVLNSHQLGDKTLWHYDFATNQYTFLRTIPD